MQDRGVRLAELMAAWSLATDVAMGAPPETGLRVCRLATRIAVTAGADEEACRRTYYAALLRHLGCTAANGELADQVGDELAYRRGLRDTDRSTLRELVPNLVRNERWHRRPRAVVRLRSGTRVLRDLGQASSEVGQALVRRLGLGSDLGHDLSLVYERYDGKGFPHRVAGSEVTLPAQCVHLADAVIANLDVGGPSHAVDMVLARRGTAFAPDLADLFLVSAEELSAGDPDEAWADVLAAEPGPVVVLDDEWLDDALQAFADFVDLKSTWTVGHSRDVASLAGDAASLLGLSPAAAHAVRRAGWLHDAGRLSVSVLVWDKDRPLTRDEWERVRLHAYFTERVFARPDALCELGVLAGLHHERLDGSGYHRSVAPASLEAQVLAAADVYAALVADRPQREAFVPLDAARVIRWEVQEGRLDPSAVEAVLQAAAALTDRRTASPAGLTDRETDVLRLLAKGRCVQEIAAALLVTPQVVEECIKAAYAKAGVRSRAAATLFAMQHGLVSALGR